MNSQKVGILHPGEMGISIAASIKNSHRQVFWASTGRSQKTMDRANEYSLTDVESLQRLCNECDVIFSVCPPHAAEEVAVQVKACSFSGMYVDANAISPQKSISIGESLKAAGITYVDGGIVGGPAWKPGTTWLHLSGEQAEAAASCFSKGPTETNIIGSEIGKASALKMCFAAYTKGTTALLSGIIATAEELKVKDQLFKQWQIFGLDFAEQSARRVQGVTAKAWRFIGEMEEISRTFEEAGLPGGFHAAAAEVYRRIGQFKDAPEMPSLEEVLKALTTAIQE